MAAGGGGLHRAELALGTRTEERFMVCFYGRTVANIDAMRVIGDRTPGDSAIYPDEDMQVVQDAEGKWRYLHKDGTPY